MRRRCDLRELGRTEWGEAFELQQRLVEERKAGVIPDQFLLLEHSHVITMGRNGHHANLLASPDVLSRSGIAFYETDRGGDVTYHGPGQIIGYPILDLRDWKRDVHEYVRAMEQVLIATLADFGLDGQRIQGCTGVWVSDNGRLAKVAAIGIHISRWITSHGFALNLNPEMTFFQYIVPCGLTKPVVSMHDLGVMSGVDEVTRSLAAHFARIFDFDLQAHQFQAEPAHSLAS